MRHRFSPKCRRLLGLVRVSACILVKTVPCTFAATSCCASFCKASKTVGGTGNENEVQHVVGTKTQGNTRNQKAGGLSD
jgi:hypothetical protein